MAAKSYPGTTIKVIGIGGAGGNAIDRMFQCKIKGIELVAVNTDAQDLKKIHAHKKVHIGKVSAGGLGAGMNPDVGKKAAEESLGEITEVLKDADMVFLAAGMGGGTGGGAAPVIAKLAKSQDILTIAVVTKPFSFEGGFRSRLASRALQELEEHVDTLLIIPNDQVLKLVNEETTVLDAFWKADEVLRQAVQGISDLIVVPGLINVDFADVRSIMKNAGQAIFGMGVAKGEKRVETAFDTALHSPLLDMSVKGAKGILFNVAGPQDLGLGEIMDAARKVQESVAPQAKIIFGAVHDPSLKSGEVRVTVIATGFSSS